MLFEWAGSSTEDAPTVRMANQRIASESAKYNFSGQAGPVTRLLVAIMGKRLQSVPVDLGRRDRLDSMESDP